MTGKSKERPGVMLYFDAVRPAISRLDETQCGVLLRSVMDYAQYGVVPELDPMTGLAFDMLVPKIDRDAERYEESREQRQYAVYTREKKRSGEPVMSIGEWRLFRQREDEKNIGPIRPDIGPLPSASTSTSTATTTSAPASPSAAGEGCKGEGEADLVYEQWLRALDARDNKRAMELDGRLFALGYQTDIKTKELRKRPGRR